MDIAVSVIVGVLLVVSALGVIVPVLPGSSLGIVALFVWAIAIGGVTGWVVFALGTLLCVSGMVASTVFAGRRMQRREIPNSSIMIGAATAIVGMFVIPVVGLFIGFALGLYGSEWYRLRDTRLALDASIVALTSLGLGIVIEFACVATAITVWIVGLTIHF